MKIINISDSRNRNSRVTMQPRKVKMRNHYVTQDGASVKNVRVVKNSLKTDIKSLTKDNSLEELSQQLVDGDPEIDFELFGKQIQETSQIYLNQNNEPALGVVP